MDDTSDFDRSALVSCLFSEMPKSINKAVYAFLNIVGGGRKLPQQNLDGLALGAGKLDKFLDRLPIAIGSGQTSEKRSGVSSLFACIARCER